MPSEFFNEELQTVDPARSFSYSINSGWGDNEWSVSGWTVTAGSDKALEHGASEAMHAMGFRWWTPQKTTRPASVPAGGVTLARQQFLMPYAAMFLNYGFGDSDLQAEFDRWRTLNNIADTRRPVGHTWGTIINWANAQNGYYTSNPDLLITAGALSFDVTTPASRAANLAKCCEYLRTTINEFDRASFDPNDGDTQSSELVFGFANDVAAELRATTHPNAMLGVYAYAGHRAPVAFPCPHVYVQVALGFNNLGIGYQALVQQWGAVANEVSLRGYGDIAAQDGWLPMNSGIVGSTFFSSAYPGYISSGANGINMETSGNWCKNIVSHYHAIRYWKTGASTHESVLAEMLPAIFGNDARVFDLFVYWGASRNTASAYTFNRSCQIIDAMPDSAHKTEFQRYMAIILRDWELTQRTVKDGVYMTRLEQNLRWSHSLRAAGTIHSYAYSRQLANSNTTTNGRPDLSFGSNPHWQRFPELPPLSAYTSARDAIARLSGRPSELEGEDLVLATVAPTGQAAASTTIATDFTTLGVATFAFIGPGTVTVTYSEAFRGPEVLEFGAGRHDFTILFNAVTTWSGGTLFLKAYPQVRLDPSVGGQRWAYIPRIVRGKVRVSSNSRLTLVDADGRKDIVRNFAPFSAGMNNPQTLVPGVARVDNINTRGTHVFGNLSPYVSPSPTVQLMPRALAVREALSFVEAA
jgi:hypothetical protein